MNIFYIHENPAMCAQQHVDKHVVKMILEYAQLLSTAQRILDGKEVQGVSKSGRKAKRWELPDERDVVLYKASHMNHPSAKWARHSACNYRWLFKLWIELMREYNYRYGKIHACEKLLDALRSTPTNIPLGDFFAPTPAMPNELKVVSNNPQPGRKYDVLKSYHNYYNGDKQRMFSWKNRQPPDWIS